MKQHDKWAYKFFREHGYTMTGAIDAAAIEYRAAERKIDVNFVNDDLPWDGDCPAPKYILHGFVCREKDLNHLTGDIKPGCECLASLGGIGVDTMMDPYLRMVGVDLLREALTELDQQDSKLAEEFFGDRHQTFAA